MSEPPEDKDEKDAIDAEFTDADVDPATFGRNIRPRRSRHSKPEPEPRWKTWAGAAWYVIFLGGIGFGAYYLVTHRVPHREPEPPKPGWELLARCSFLASFDGNKNLSFSEDGRAELYDNTNTEKDDLKGEWRFDEETKLLAVIFDGVSKSYAWLSQGKVRSACC